MNIIRKLVYYPYLQNLSMLVLRRWRFKKCGRGVKVKRPLLISYKVVELGNNVRIWFNCRIQGVYRYAGETFTPTIILDDGVSVQQNLHLTCANYIYIGKNTAVAANVTITDIDHQYIDISIAPERQPLTVKPVEIGEDCKIYNNAVILPGTRLGKHCIVGANSVVSGIFDDFCVIVGAPARVVKRYNLETKLWERV